MRLAAREPEAVLAAGLADLGLRAAPSCQERLLLFLAELGRWNRAYNLVADAPPLAWVRAHLLDSLSVADRLRDVVSEGSVPAPAAPGRAPSVARGARPPGPPRVLDLGTGAGFPGIPLAVALPELRFVLLDGNGKKVRFCRHVVDVLELANVEVVQDRAETYLPAAPFDAAVARAVGSLARVRGLVGRNCRGPVLVMKGRWPASEIAALGDVPYDSTRLRVPGLGAARHLVVLR